MTPTDGPFDARLRFSPAAAPSAASASAATTPPETVIAGGPPPFAALNRIAEPLVRLGVGAPLPLPGWFWIGGLVVLEVVGRRSGRRIRVPLVAAARGHRVLVTTARADSSQWLRNLERMERARLWLRGRERTGVVTSWRPEGPPLPWFEDRFDRLVVTTLASLGLGGGLVELDSSGAELDETP